MDPLTHYLQIVLLGIVEGVTEFLPISSTGHLLIAEHLLGTNEPDVFNVVIQAGAILAVVFIYWHKIMDLIGNLDKAEYRNYLLKVILAFVVTSVVALVLVKHFHLKLPETLTPVAWATLIGGFVIFGVEMIAKNLYPHDDVSWFEAILIGAAQVLAGVFPGTSRSGATIMTGMAMGMRRPAATEFAFLLGIPTMFAASALDLWRARKDLTTGDHQLLLDIALGFVVSGVVAFFVVKWLLRFVQSHTFNGFAIYRIILGVILLTAITTHVLPEIGQEKPEVKVPPPMEPASSQPAVTTNADSTPAIPSTSETNFPPTAPATNAVIIPVTPTTNTPPVAPEVLTPENPVTNAAPAHVQAPQN